MSKPPSAPQIADLLQKFDARGGTLAHDPQLQAQVTAAKDTLRATTRTPRPLAVLHHFARAGGTVISRMLAAQTATVVLSELDPHSDFRQDSFAPTDVLHHARKAVTGMDTASLGAVFYAGLEALLQQMDAQERHVILRVHSHGFYCRDIDVRPGPSVQAQLSDKFDTRGSVTLRHPLDSYLSLVAKDWIHFEPATLEEYARRYLIFLDHTEGLPRFHYETFTAQPDVEARKICDHYGLAYVPDWQDVMSAIVLSGDDTPSSQPIAQMARKPVNKTLVEACGQSAVYAELCQHMGYDPDPGGSQYPQ